ncbi:MAG: four helix bundle protein [Chitinophagales bacterium]
MEKESPKNLIVNLSFEFALQIIDYCELLETKKKYVISNQLLKSGTSIGANVKEAQNAESKNDFIHKLKIALKEAEETEYWLLLCASAKQYPNPEDLSDKIKSLLKVLTKIINTSKNNNR